MTIPLFFDLSLSPSLYLYFQYKEVNLALKLHTMGIEACTEPCIQSCAHTQAHRLCRKRDGTFHLFSLMHLV